MQQQLLKKIRILTVFFIIVLALSGITAFPVYTELSFLQQHGWMNDDQFFGPWLNKVYNGATNTYNKYPFLFYGYDWLAFAHFVLAILFIGPYKDPVKNIWVIQFGLIACTLVIPFAFVAGQARGIPIGWRLIDCSFGVFGFLLLWIIYSKTKTFLNK